jgi:hypothetical protein
MILYRAILDTMESGDQDMKIKKTELEIIIEAADQAAATGDINWRNFANTLREKQKEQKEGAEEQTHEPWPGQVLPDLSLP